MTRRFEWVAVGLVVLAACIVMLAGLGLAPLQDYDEATYAQVTHEMLTSGNYLSPTHTGENYFEKPPLYFWAAAASTKLFGESEFSLRLPSAVAGIALVILTILFAFELSGSLSSGALGGAILLTMAPVAETARQVRIDVPITLFITLAAYAWVRAQHDARWYLLFGLAAGLAVMTKDVIGVFAFAAAAAWCLYTFNVSFLRNKQFWWGILIFLVVSIPWHIYMTLHFGAAFWREYIGFDVIKRSAVDLFMVHITNADYVWYLANFAAPWAQLFLPALVALSIWWEKFDVNTRRGTVFAATMVAIILTVFFYSGTKAPTYLIPLYPFAALMLALLYRIIAEHKIAKITIALLLVVGTASTVYNVFHFNSYYAQSDELAREEKIVGLDMKNSQNDFFAFQTTTLSSIMYYSRNTKPLAFDMNAPEGSFVVLPTTSEKSLTELYPTLKTQTLYSGPQITLLQVE